MEIILYGKIIKLVFQNFVCMRSPCVCVRTKPYSCNLLVNFMSGLVKNFVQYWWPTPMLPDCSLRTYEVSLPSIGRNVGIGNQCWRKMEWNFVYKYVFFLFLSVDLLYRVEQRAIGLFLGYFIPYYIGLHNWRKSRVGKSWCTISRPLSIPLKIKCREVTTMLPNTNYLCYKRKIYLYTIFCWYMMTMYVCVRDM